MTDENEAPVAGDISFNVAESAPNGSVFGTLSAVDPDAGQSLSYSIIAGDPTGVFTIDPATGALSVNDTSQLDAVGTPVYTLTVQVADDGTPALSDTALVTVNVTDGNQQPTVADQSFSVPEDAADGTTVGTVSASDPDVGQSLTYAVIAGDPTGVFAMEAATGTITVADASQLDFEATPEYTLTVQVSDNGTPVLSETATITIGVTDVEAAITPGQSFNVSETATNGTVVGSVADNRGRSHGLCHHGRRRGRCVRHRCRRSDHGGRCQQAGFRDDGLLHADDPGHGRHDAGDGRRDGQRDRFRHGDHGRAELQRVRDGGQRHGGGQRGHYRRRGHGLCHHGR